MSELSVFIEKVKYSIANYGVTIEEIRDSECEEHNGHYYDSDNYCVCEGDIYYKDDVNYCKGLGAYTTDDLFKCNEGRREVYYSKSYIDRGEYHFHNGEYYDYDGLDYYNLVLMPDGEVEYRDNVYYWESDGEYHYSSEEPDYDDSDNDYTRDYHNGYTEFVDFEGKSKFRIGFEIEKEDKSVKESIDIDDFESNCPKWRKERDGSLNDESGYELISPAFEFDIKAIFEEIESNSTLVEHINANYSLKCGGHINLSQNGLTGLQLFNKIKGYTPLLHALYFGRVNKDYCKGKSNENIVSDNEKYQAIRIHNDRIEIRIFSAVRNVETLKWRCKLLQQILKYPSPDIKQAFYYVSTRFNKLLLAQYPDKIKMDALHQRIVKYSMDFEGVTPKKREPKQQLLKVA